MARIGRLGHPERAVTRHTQEATHDESKRGSGCRAIVTAWKKALAGDNGQGSEWDKLVFERQSEPITMMALDFLFGQAVFHHHARLKALEQRIRELEARPAPVSYEGTWTESRKYSKGQLVTSSGSIWHCNTDNISTRPGSVSGPWTLACKSGRDLR